GPDPRRFVIGNEHSGIWLSTFPLLHQSIDPFHMTTSPAEPIPISNPASRRADELFDQTQLSLWQRTDRLFAGLMVFQWLACIGAALWITPRTWIGTTSQVHV